MTGILKFNRNLITFGIPLSFLGVLIFLMRSPFLTGNSVLSFAVTVDLLITIPLVYFLLIRKTQIPATTVIPVMIAGLIIGSYFLPKDSQTYLTIFKTLALPVIEISILTYMIIKVRRAIKKYTLLKKAAPDFFNALKSTCYEFLPKRLVMPIATEIAVIYYGFITWKTRQPQENEFTYHKKSGTPALLGAFILIIGIETVAVHFLLAHWNIIAAWVLSTVSIYTAIQVLGVAKSLSKRLVSISQNSLILRYGILNEVEISFSDIDNIEFSRKPLAKDELTTTLSPLSEIESHNMIIHLNRERELVGIYGVKKKFRVIALHIDEPKGFIEKMGKALR